MGSVGRKRIFNDQWYDRIAIFFIASLAAVMITATLITANYPTGECASFIPPTVSILQGDWYLATSRAIDTAIQEMPDFAEYLQEERYTRYGTRLSDGGYVPLYFPTYSLVCIPARLVLKILRLNQSYTFRLTNVLLFTAALMFVWKGLKAKPATRLLLLLALGISPILFYLFWVSYEVCIWAFLVVAMVLWWNGSYRLSAFVLAWASTMNAVIIFFGLAMIALYFIEKRPLPLTLEKLKDLLIYAACFLPFFIPFINAWLVSYFTGVKPFDLLSNWQFSYYFTRLWTYFFDLNLGFLPYVPLLLLLFIGVVIYTAIKIKTEYRYFLSALGFLFVVLGYTLMLHINCGMEGMARYNAWALPMMCFTVILFGQSHFPHHQKKVALLFLASAACTFLVLFVMFRMPTKGSAGHFNFIAAFVLEHAPGLYNPYYATFNARTNHLDGGYDILEPVVYSNKLGQVRKILIRGNERDKERLLTYLSGDLSYINARLSAIPNDDGFHYINVPRPNHIFYGDYLPNTVGATVTVYPNDPRLTRAGEEDDGIFAAAAGTRAVLFGPYRPAIPGTYTFTLSYEVLAHTGDTDVCGFFDVLLWTEDAHITTGDILASEQSVTIDNLVFPDGVAPLMENRVFLHEGTRIKIRSIDITKKG